MAAVVGVLAAATLAIGESGGIALVRPSHVDLIEAHLEAWYGGDYETAESLRAPQTLRTGPPEERARDEVEYQALLAAEGELLTCEPLPPSTMRCDVAYSNVLNQAVGQKPAVVPVQVGVEDGRILFVAGPYLEDESLSRSFRRFAELHFAAEFSAACVDEPGFQPPSCAELKLDKLEDWASWHRIQQD